MLWISLFNLILNACIIEISWKLDQGVSLSTADNQIVSQPASRNHRSSEYYVICFHWVWESMECPVHSPLYCNGICQLFNCYSDRWSRSLSGISQMIFAHSSLSLDIVSIRHLCKYLNFSFSWANNTFCESIRYISTFTSPIQTIELSLYIHAGTCGLCLCLEMSVASQLKFPNVININSIKPKCNFNKNRGKKTNKTKQHKIIWNAKKWNIKHHQTHNSTRNGECQSIAIRIAKT